MTLVTVLMMILPNIIGVKPEEIAKSPYTVVVWCVRPGQGDPTARGRAEANTGSHLQPQPLQRRPLLIWSYGRELNPGEKVAVRLRVRGAISGGYRSL